MNSFCHTAALGWHTDEKQTVGNIFLPTEYCHMCLRYIKVSNCCGIYFQLDLVNEARCLDKFGVNFSTCARISVPIPIWPYITKEVLVETFEVTEYFIVVFLKPSSRINVSFVEGIMFHPSFRIINFSFLTFRKGNTYQISFRINSVQRSSRRP